MTPEDRRRLGALSALVLGIFLGLCLIPGMPTGALGRTLGGLLWRSFGAGAVGLPLLGLALALAGFDRLPRLDMKRAAVLLGGLSLLVPFVIGVVVGSIPADFDPRLADWSAAARGAGLLPGLLAYGVVGLVGKTGGLLLGFLLLSALTILTLAWHPLRRLEKVEGEEAVTAGPERSARTPRPKREPKSESESEPEPALAAAAPPGLDAGRKSRSKATSLAEAATAGERRPEDSDLPPVSLLREPAVQDTQADEAELDRLGNSLLETLRTFKVDGSIAGRTSGPVVTQFEVVPGPGVKAGRIVSLADDLAITMRATSIRVAPIPDKGAVGVEIPESDPPDGHAPRAARGDRVAPEPGHPAGGARA